MTLKGDANFKAKLTRGFENDKTNLVSFMRAVKRLKICTLMDFF